jgi:hypothetical protein
MISRWKWAWRETGVDITTLFYRHPERRDEVDLGILPQRVVCWERGSTRDHFDKQTLT